MSPVVHMTRIIVREQCPFDVYSMYLTSIDVRYVLYTSNKLPAIHKINSRAIHIKINSQPYSCSIEFFCSYSMCTVCP